MTSGRTINIHRRSLLPVAGRLGLAKKIGVSTLLLALCSAPAQSAFAWGTPSGTVITNTVAVTYDDGGGVVTMGVDAVPTVGDNKINLIVTNLGKLTVLPGLTNQALPFSVKNAGNTTQRYALAAINSGGIALENVRIYLDNGTIPGLWDAGDTLYVDASTFGDVRPDGILQVLIVADIPAGATSGQPADYQLLATTVDAGTTRITIQTGGANTAGVDVVFGDLAGSAAKDRTRDGKHSDQGTYTVNNLELLLSKAVTVVWDPDNLFVNPRSVHGAVLTYKIIATISGGGTATGVVISDPIPAKATYVANSLKLNGAALSDAADSDGGSVGGSPVTVMVRLPNLTSLSPPQEVSFDVKIDDVTTGSNTLAPTGL